MEQRSVSSAAWTMGLFISFALLGLAFMVYALIQFSLEAKRNAGARWGNSNPKTREVELRNLIEMHLPRAVADISSYKRRTAEWSHGNGEIQVRTISNDSHVVVRRLRAGARDILDVSRRSRGS